MKPLLLASFMMLFQTRCFCQQPVQLHLKKNGKVKKRIELGTPVLVITKRNEVIGGAMIQLRKDSLYFNHAIVAAKDIQNIKLPRIKPKMKFNWKEFGYISLGVGLTTAGLTLANWRDFKEALSIGSAIGYSPYLLRMLKFASLKKREFRLGKKYALRIWDIR